MEAEAQQNDYHSNIRGEVFDLLSAQAYEGVLDVGGGYGNTAAAIKERFGADNVGVIDLVADRSTCNPLLDFAYSGDLNDEEFINEVGRCHGPFDVILCMDVLEHLVDPWECLLRLERLLSPNGVLVVSVPNVAHISVRLGLFFQGRWRYADKGIHDRTHLRFFDRKTAEDLVQHGELKIFRSTFAKSEWRRWSLVNWLSAFGLKDLVAYQYFFAARRAVE